METKKRNSGQRNPIQELNQNVCQKYGWCAELFEERDGTWSCRVVVGMDTHRLFRTTTVATMTPPTTPTPEETAATTPFDDSIHKQIARRQAAAAQAALDGLRDDIARQEAKPVWTLEQLFASHHDQQQQQRLDIYDSSNAANWDYFWSHKPVAVGIDTEGNRLSPPVLVQIATPDYVILEVPTEGRCLSTDLKRLLDDETIVKVFCDNFSHSDKKCLGVFTDTSTSNTNTTTTTTTSLWTQGHVVDVEEIASQWLGVPKAARGLARILSLCYCTDVLIRKPPAEKRFFGGTSSIQKFCLIEQGKAPLLQSISDLTVAERQYAALDAWYTLLAYTCLCEFSQSKDASFAVNSSHTTDIGHSNYI